MDVQHMWEQCSSRRLSEVAQENNLSPQKLVAMFDQAGLTGRTAADPGPDEIAVAAAAIRRTWTPEVERQRWIAARRLNGAI